MGKAQDFKRCPVHGLVPAHHNCVQVKRPFAQPVHGPVVVAAPKPKALAFGFDVRKGDVFTFRQFIPDSGWDRFTILGPSSEEGDGWWEVELSTPPTPGVPGIPLASTKWLQEKCTRLLRGPGNA